MESLVGYASDEDIPDRRYSNADMQEQEQRDSKGRERSEMDNYDNIQMDMSEDSNSASVESGGSWRGNPDSHVPEESWKKRDEEKRGGQHPGNNRVQKPYHRDEKQNITGNSHSEKLHEESKYSPARRDDRKPTVENRSENNFSGNSSAGDHDHRTSRAQRDEDKSYEEDRGHRRLEGEDKHTDKYDNSKRGDRRFEEEKRDDRHNNYHSEEKRSGCEKQENKPFTDVGRNPRVEKYNDNNKSDRDDRRSTADKRDSKSKSDRNESRSSAEKRDKYKARPEDGNERSSKRSHSREKTSDGKRTSHDRDQRKSVRSGSREKASDGGARRSSRDRDDKRPRRSKSRERSIQAKRASYERDEKKSRRSGSRDRRSEHRRDGNPRRTDEDRQKDRQKDRRYGKDRSRSPARTYGDKRKSRSPSHGGSRSSPANERRGTSPKRAKRSPDRRRGSRERNPGGGRTQFDKKPSKLSILERLGITLPTVTDLQGAVTPQQLVQRSMALQVQQVKSTTGIELPSYYNPAAMNPARYAEQIQKRRLLWGNKGEAAKPAEAAAAPVQAQPVAGANKWEGTTFKSDHDGMMTAKFKRLMGIKNQDSSAGEGSSGAGNKPAEGNEIIKKQEEMFNSMEMQYEVARVATHTHRGLGLGFGTFQYPR